MITLYLIGGGLIAALLLGLWIGRKSTMAAVREIEQARDQAIRSWNTERQKNMQLQRQNAALKKARDAAREQQKREDEIHEMDSDNIADALDAQFGGLPDDDPADA